MLLIDSDFLVWRASNGKRDFLQCIEAIDWHLEQIFQETGDREYRLFLSCRSFRHQVSPTYKATRKIYKPLYFKELRQYLIDEWGAEQVEGLEADDLCGIYQEDDTIIVGEDKDLLTVSGAHFRLNRTKPNELIYVTKEEADTNFWVQLLTGDAADNIEGIKNPAKSHHKKQPNFTDATARQILKGDKEKLVQNLYKKQYGKQWKQKYETNYKLLRILREFPLLK